MRHKKLVLAAVTAAGVLIMGIGLGVTVAEYSAFEYLGQKNLGEDQMEVKEIAVERTPGVPFVLENWYDPQNVEIVEDESLPDNQLVYEVEYNRETIRPHVEMWKENPEPEGSDPRQPGPGEDLPEEGPATEHFRIYSSYMDHPQYFWDHKDEMLGLAKKKQFYTYDVVYWGKITVRMSPQSKRELEIYGSVW